MFHFYKRRAWCPAGLMLLQQPKMFPTGGMCCSLRNSANVLQKAETNTLTRCTYTNNRKSKILKHTEQMHQKNAAHWVNTTKLSRPLEKHRVERLDFQPERQERPDGGEFVSEAGRQRKNGKNTTSLHVTSLFHFSSTSLLHEQTWFAHVALPKVQTIQSNEIIHSNRITIHRKLFNHFKLPGRRANLPCFLH